MSIQPTLSYKERREKIIEYIRNHLGCKKNDLVKNLENEISRVTIFKITNELIKEKIIEERSKNRRDLALYLNNDNPLLRLTKEIDQFEKAYMNLLDKSKERIEKKDFVTIANIVNLSSSNPQRWIDEDRVKFQEYEQKNIRNYIISSDELIKLNKKIKNRLSNEKTQNLLQLINTDEITSKEKIPIVKRMDLETLKSKFNELRLEIMGLKYYFSNLDQKEWAKNFEFKIIIITLTQIFFILSDILFSRLTFIWSKNIQDKDLLQRLSFLVSDKISKINLKLLEFINSIKALLAGDEYMKEMINNRFQSQSWSVRMSRYFYKGLKMEKYIDEVINSILVLDEELKQYRSTPLYSAPEIFNEIDGYYYFIENPNMPYIDDQYYFIEHIEFDPDHGYLEPIYNPSEVGDYDYYIIENFSIPAIVHDLEEKEKTFEKSETAIRDILSREREKP